MGDLSLHGLHLTYLRFMVEGSERNNGGFAFSVASSLRGSRLSLPPSLSQLPVVGYLCNTFPMQSCWQAARTVCLSASVFTLIKTTGFFGPRRAERDGWSQPGEITAFYFFVRGTYGARKWSDTVVPVGLMYSLCDLVGDNMAFVPPRSSHSFLLLCMRLQ